jgi:hypothetical protein
LASLALGGREEDQDLEFFGYVVEAVADFCRYEDYAASGNLAIFEAGFEAGAAADHEVDLVLAMRLLVVYASGGQDVEAGADSWNAEELAVGLAAAGALLGNLRKARKNGFHTF